MRNIQTYIVTFLLVVISGFSGYYFGVKGYEVKVSNTYREVKIENKQSTLPDTIDFSKFWSIWDTVNRSHIKKPLNAQKLLDGAIAGMVSAIGDPYTLYLNQERNKEVRSDLNGEYEGIGAQLGYDENQILMIVAPLDGSPALAAGIKAGDKILKIDGVTTQGLSVEEAVQKIRGAAGTVVTLNVFRTGQKAANDINITRSNINIESVKWEDKGDGVAYIRLSRFGENTNKDWGDAISKIKYQMPTIKAIVLDVRNNPGGYLDSAVFIASEFIDKGIVVSEKVSDGSTNDFNVARQGDFTDKSIKIVVLVNKGSASASEIVAGALKEKRNAQIVGERSFGKGTVQKDEEYKDGSALHVTIAKWITPNGNWIDKANSKFPDSVYNDKDANGKETVGGIRADFPVEFTEDDVKNSKDPQLDKAVEVAKGK